MLKSTAKHLKKSSSSSLKLGKVNVINADDIVIVDAVRTPLCKSRSGAFKDLNSEDLLKAALLGLLERTKIDPKLIEDVVAGNVLAVGSGATLVRMCSLAVGIPTECPAMSINRLCSSGLQAICSIAASIRAGYIEIGIGAGFESMSKDYGPQALLVNVSSEVLHPSATELGVIDAQKQVPDCLLPMGITSENVCKDFGMDRRTLDEFALSSCLKASKAVKEGLFESEIVPVNGQMTDDSIRHDVSMDALSNLKPAFTKDGCTTAGNASKVSDGAAAALVMKRSTAERLGLKPRAKLISYAVVGVPPRIMGVGPAFAIPAALKQAQISSVEDVDVFEINEAFASQAVYCVDHLQIPKDRVNQRGGAIAMGHPLGCTGARQMATILPILESKRSKALGVISMCIGTGMGAACVLQSEH